MRMPNYISPSSLTTWEIDREEFYKKYLCECRMPRDPQTPAMSVGSAFDAYVKAALWRELFGGFRQSDDYSLDALMESQVEAHVRDWARNAGRHVFDCYKYTGAYDELLGELRQATDVPRFEFTATGTVAGVPVSGKPDCCYTHQSGALVMLDWKVNGYCSKRAVSPKKLHVMCRDGQEMKRPSLRNGKPHKNYQPKFFKGLTIGSHCLAQANPSWADQLAIYGWMAGVPVGSEEMVSCIDQIVAKPAEFLPTLRVAQHRARISTEWQEGLVDRLTSCWEVIQSGHIFTDRSREESDANCEVLDMVVEDMRPDDDPYWRTVKGRMYK